MMSLFCLGSMMFYFIVLQNSSWSAVSADNNALTSPPFFTQLYNESPGYQMDMGALDDDLEDDDLDEDDDMDSEAEESKKSSSFQNTARMNLWKRLGRISEWMDRMSVNYARGQPKLFERLSRGRLDRMPLSYGKRSESDQDIPTLLDNEDNLRNIMERLSKYPVHYGKASLGFDEHQADETSDVFMEPFLKRLTDLADLYKEEILKKGPTVSEHRDTSDGVVEKRDRLNRMPISFGKRNWDDFFSAIQYNRIPRGRLDRMPLTFGKRTDKQKMFIKCLKEKSGLPFVFAQKSEEGNILLRCSEAKHEMELISPGTRERSTNHNGWVKGRTLAPNDGWTPHVRVRRSRLGRMPVSFGKRSEPQPWQTIDDDLSPASASSSEQVKVQGRSRMDRMPLTFGKRLDNIGHLDRYSKRHRLDRMPLNFGKRDSFLWKELASVVDTELEEKNQDVRPAEIHDVDIIDHQNTLGNTLTTSTTHIDTATHSNRDTRSS